MVTLDVNVKLCFFALQPEASATLMGSVGGAISTALESGCAPSVCAASRTAGAANMPACIMFSCAVLRQPHSLHCTRNFPGEGTDLIDWCACGAEAMTEARARASPGTSEAERVCSTVTDALEKVLQSGASPAERCAALQALIWAQVLCFYKTATCHSSL